MSVSSRVHPFARANGAEAGALIYRPSLPADLVPSKGSFRQASGPSDFSLFVLLGFGKDSAIPVSKRKQEP